MYIERQHPHAHTHTHTHTHTHSVFTRCPFLCVVFFLRVCCFYLNFPVGEKHDLDERYPDTSCSLRSLFLFLLTSASRVSCLSPQPRSLGVAHPPLGRHVLPRDRHHVCELPGICSRTQCAQQGNTLISRYLYSHTHSMLLMLVCLMCLSL